MWFLVLLAAVAGTVLLYLLVRIAAKHGYRDALREAESGPEGRRTGAGSDLIGTPEEKPARPAGRPGNQTAAPRDF